MIQSAHSWVASNDGACSPNHPPAPSRASFCFPVCHEPALPGAQALPWGRVSKSGTCSTYFVQRRALSDSIRLIRACNPSTLAGFSDSTMALHLQESVQQSVSRSQSPAAVEVLDLLQEVGRIGTSTRRRKRSHGDPAPPHSPPSPEPANPPHLGVFLSVGFGCRRFFRCTSLS